MKRHLENEGFEVRESPVTRGMLTIARTLKSQQAYVNRRLQERNETIVSWSQLDHTSSVYQTVSFFVFFKTTDTNSFPLRSPGLQDIPGRRRTCQSMFWTGTDATGECQIS